MPKIYRTMQGEKVDIEALFRRNELTQAVGNMKTNARGDELGPGGSIVKTREQKAREYYLKQKAAKAAAKKEEQNKQQTTDNKEPSVPELKKEESKKVKNKKPNLNDFDDLDGELE